MTDSPRALLVGYGGGHSQLLIPVARELARRRWKVSILGLTTAARSLKRSGLPFRGFRDYVREDDERALEIGRRLTDEIFSPDLGFSREESIAYLGLSYVDLEKREGVDRARDLYEQHGRKAFLPVSVLGRVIDHVRPDVVVTTNSPRAERAAVVVAKEQNIPTVSLVDLFGIQEMYELCADTICVLSEETKAQLLREWPIPAQSIKVTGSPLFDEVIRFRGSDRHSVKREVFGENPTPKTWMVWIDQPGYRLLSENRHYSRSEADILSDLDTLRRQSRNLGIGLAVRPHPSQSLGLFEDWRGQDADVRIFGGGELYSILVAADVVVTRTSTAGLEAVLLGRPVVAVDPEPGLSNLPIAYHGLAAHARRMEETELLVNKILRDTDYRSTLESAYKRLPADGAATKRVVDEIELSLGGSRH